MVNGPWARAANAVNPLCLCLAWLIFVFPTVLAQGVTLLPSSASDSFPACALNCALLQQAQGSCVPPAAPKSDSSTYVTCFCQSSLISSLHSSPAGVCDDSCNNPSDLSLLQKWFNNYCSSGGNVQTSTATTTTTTASSASETTTGTADKAPASASNSGPPSWWSTHYRWVIMIIVLAIGFTILGVGGTYLKRRHDAKNPGLYHGADSAGSNSNSNSKIFSSRGQTASPGPDIAGPGHFAPLPVKHNSVPTEVAVPKDIVPQTRTPSRLQRQRPPDSGDLEITEIGR